MRRSRRLGAATIGAGAVVVLALGAFDYARIGHVPAPCPTAGSGRPSVTFVPSGGPNYERTRRAVALYQTGRIDRLIFSGAGHGGDSAPRLAREARRLGVPKTRILVEDRARSTAENFRYGCALAALDDSDRVAIVTHRFHAERAYLTARRQCPAPTFCSASVDHPVTPERRRREALRLWGYQLLGRAAWW